MDSTTTSRSKKHPTSHEWEMKNLTLSDLPNPPENPNPEKPDAKQEGKGGREEEEEKRVRCEWDFTLSTVVSSTTAGATAVSDTLSAIEFDPSGRVLATGGIARKIRVYSLESLLLPPHEKENKVTWLDHNGACDYYICTPAKLSSLRWKPESGRRIIASGDYDGVVTEYDTERRVPVFERDEHGGRRVWSMDYSHSDPGVGASGSDDGTLQMWDPRCGGGGCVATVQPGGACSSVCCVEFNPFGGALVAVGCADQKAYGYDVRRMREPVMVLHGHSKTVSYVRFLDHHKVVTLGIDGCLKLWKTEDSSLIQTYTGHVNSRRFVGLSVWRQGGLLGCGSEDNRVFVYDERWGEPIWVHGFEPAVRPGCDSGFVGGVCWRQVAEDGCNLVAGGSDGVLQVFEGKRL